MSKYDEYIQKIDGLISSHEKWLDEKKQDQNSIHEINESKEGEFFLALRTMQVTLIQEALQNLDEIHTALSTEQSEHLREKYKGNLDQLEIKYPMETKIFSSTHVDYFKFLNQQPISKSKLEGILNFTEERIEEQKEKLAINKVFQSDFAKELETETKRLTEELEKLRENKRKFIADYNASLAGICKRFDVNALRQWLQPNEQHPDVLNQALLLESDELPLTFCCQQTYSVQQITFIHALLEQGAQINAKNYSPHQYTALHIATKQGNIDLIKFLLKQGADPNVRSHGENNTPFHLAIIKGDLPIVDIFLSQPLTEYYLPDAQNHTALMIAVRQGETHLSLIKKLLSQNITLCRGQVLTPEDNETLLILAQAPNMSRTFAAQLQQLLTQYFEMHIAAARENQEALQRHINYIAQSVEREQWSIAYQEAISFLGNHKEKLKEQLPLLKQFLSAVLQLNKHLIQTKHSLQVQSLYITSLESFLYLKEINHLGNANELIAQHYHCSAMATENVHLDENSIIFNLEKFADDQERALRGYFSAANKHHVFAKELQKNISRVIARVEYACAKPWILMHWDDINLRISLQWQPHWQRVNALGERLRYCGLIEEARSLYHDSYEAVVKRAESSLITLLMNARDTAFSSITPTFAWPAHQDTFIKNKNFLSNLNNENIKDKQEQFICSQKDLLKNIICKAHDLLGPPPCEFSVILTGSYATGLAGIYSDAEFFCIFEKESEVKKRKHNFTKEKQISYLRSLFYLIKIELGGIGEPAFALDKNDLLGTIDEFIARLGKDSYDNIHSLLHGDFLYGEEKLWNDYNAALSYFFQDNKKKLINDLIKMKNGENLSNALKSETLQNVEFDLKKDFISPLYYWVSETALCCLPTVIINFRDSLQQLKNMKIFPDKIFDLILDSMNASQVIRNALQKNVMQEKYKDRLTWDEVPQYKSLLQQINPYLLLPFYILSLPDRGNPENSRHIADIPDLINQIEHYLYSLPFSSSLSVKMKWAIHALAYWHNQLIDTLPVSNIESAQLFFNLYKFPAVKGSAEGHNHMIQQFYIDALKIVANLSNDNVKKNILRNNLEILGNCLMPDGWSYNSENKNKNFEEDLYKFFTLPFSRTHNPILRDHLFPLTLYTIIHNTNNKWDLTADVVDQLQGYSPNVGEFRFKDGQHIDDPILQDRHLVLPVERYLEGSRKIFWIDIAPRRPGVEFEVSKLMQRLVGSGYYPHTQIGRLSGPQQKEIAVQIREDIKGTSLGSIEIWQDNIINNITFSSFFAQLLRVLITRPKNEKVDDYLLIPLPEMKKYKLFNRNLGQSFHEPITEKKGLITNTYTLHLKSILLCLPQMLKEIDLDDPIVTDFLSISSYAVLKSWLKDLQDEHANYMTLFSDTLFTDHYSDIKAHPQGLERLLGIGEWVRMYCQDRSLHSSFLTVPIDEAIIYQSNYRITMLQEILRFYRLNKIKLFPETLLKQLYPRPHDGKDLYEDYYRPLLGCHNVEYMLTQYPHIKKILGKYTLNPAALPIMRFLALTHNHVIVERSMNLSFGATRSVIIEEKPPLSQEKALEIWCGENLKNATVAFNNLDFGKGEEILESLFALKENEKIDAQALIMDFLQLDIINRKRLIEPIKNGSSKYKIVKPEDHVYLLRLMAGLHFTHLDLTKFSEHLTGKLLINLLKTNNAGEHLRSLNLTGCKLLEITFAKLAKHAPNLKELRLKESKITTLGEDVYIDFKRLESLDISGSPLLTHVDITASRLTSLKASQCEKLTFLEIHHINDETASAILTETVFITQHRPEKQMLYLSHDDAFSEFSREIKDRLLILTKINNVKDTLDLSYGNLNRKHMSTIVAVLCHPNCQIKKLDLSFNLFDDEDAKKLERGLLYRTRQTNKCNLITTLFITGNLIGALAEIRLRSIIIFNQKLQELHQSNSPLGSKYDLSFPFLSAMLAKRLIEMVKMENCPISSIQVDRVEAGAEDLKDELYSLLAVNVAVAPIDEGDMTITHVSIFSESIGVSALKKLFEQGLHKKRYGITEIELVCYDLDAAGAKYLLHCLYHTHPHIKCIINAKKIPNLILNMEAEAKNRIILEAGIETIIQHLKGLLDNQKTEQISSCLEIYKLRIGQGYYKTRSLLEALFNSEKDNRKQLFDFLNSPIGFEIFKDYRDESKQDNTVLEKINSWLIKNEAALLQVILEENIPLFLLFYELKDEELKQRIHAALQQGLLSGKGRAFACYAEKCYESVVPVVTEKNALIPIGYSQAHTRDTWFWRKARPLRCSVLTYGAFETSAKEIFAAAGSKPFTFIQLKQLFESGGFGAYLYLEHLGLLDLELEPAFKIGEKNDNQNNLYQLFQTKDKKTGDTYLHYLAQSWMKAKTYEKELILTGIKWIVEFYDKEKKLRKMRNKKGEYPFLLGDSVLLEYLHYNEHTDFSADMYHITQNHPTEILALKKHIGLVRGPLRFLFESKRTIYLYYKAYYEENYFFYKKEENAFLEKFNGILGDGNKNIQEKEDDLIALFLMVCKENKFLSYLPYLCKELLNLIRRIDKGETEHYQALITTTISSSETNTDAPETQENIKKSNVTGEAEKNKGVIGENKEVIGENKEVIEEKKEVIEEKKEVIEEKKEAIEEKKEAIEEKKEVIEEKKEVIEEKKEATKEATEETTKETLITRAYKKQIEQIQRDNIYSRTTTGLGESIVIKPAWEAQKLRTRSLSLPLVLISTHDSKFSK